MTTSTEATATPERTALQIDVWSDLACPWCYIGKHRLDEAIAASPHAENITVRVHSYELDPAMSPEPTPNIAVLAAKYGLSEAEARHAEDKVIAIAHGDGLPFSPDRVIANSFDVHRVLHLASTVGEGDELLGHLQRALFSGESDPYDHAVLTEAAVEVGLPRDRVEQVLEGDEYADAVRADEAQAQQLGITGVPFTVLDERLAIPGSTSVEGFAAAIERAWSEQ